MKLTVEITKLSASLNLHGVHNCDEMNTKTANMKRIKLLNTVGKKITASTEIKRNLLIRKNLNRINKIYY